MGGDTFLLKCNHNIETLPLKLSNFHKKALLAQKLIYKHNLSPPNYYIWNNRNIQYKRKSRYYERWVERGILLVRQFVNADGQLLTYNEFLSKFDLPVTPKEYAVVFDALPRSVQQLDGYSDIEVSVLIFLAVYSLVKWTLPRDNAETHT